MERSGFRLVNFCASLQTVMIKKKALRMMMKHTGPKKLQMRPSFRDSQQLVRKKETLVNGWFFFTRRACNTPAHLVSPTHDTYCCSVPYPAGLMMADIVTITRGIP